MCIQTCFEKRKKVVIREALYTLCDDVATQAEFDWDPAIFQLVEEIWGQAAHVPKAIRPEV